MSPLSVELYRPGSGWVQVGEVKPGGHSSSQRITRPNGQHDVYHFECAPDDSRSIVYRHRFGLTGNYMVPGDFRVAVELNQKVIKNLEPGKSFEMEVQTDQSPEPKKIRITHK